MNTGYINWEKAYGGGRDYAPLTTADIAFLKGSIYADAPATHLDIGCGTGQICRELFHRGFKTVGMDLAKTAISQAKASTVFSGGKIRFIRGDFNGYKQSSMPYAPYGLITSKYVYTFISNKNLFLSKVNKLLHRKGVFIVISPDQAHLPEHKKNIGVPDRILLDELSKTFHAESYKRGRDFYYVCRCKFPNKLSH